MPITLRTETDPKRQPGAYLSLNGALYCVEHFQRTGVASGFLHVINCLSERPAMLTCSETENAILERAAP